MRQQGIAADVLAKRRGQDMSFAAQQQQGLAARAQEQNAAMGNAKLGIEQDRLGLDKEEAKRRAEAGNTDWRVQVTPSTRSADGSTAEGSVIRYNQRTGQVEKIRGGQASVPQGMTAIGRTPDGRTVYRDQSGKTVVQAA